MAFRAMAVGMAASTEAGAATARAYMALATTLLARPERGLVAVGGLSGTGKSTLAAAIACRLAPGAGAVTVSSDVIRKRLMGAAPEQALPHDAYMPEISAQVYERLFYDVAAALAERGEHRRRRQAELALQRPPEVAEAVPDPASDAP